MKPWNMQIGLKTGVDVSEIIEWYDKCVIPLKIPKKTKNGTIMRVKAWPEAPHNVCELVRELYFKEGWGTCSLGRLLQMSKTETRGFLLKSCKIELRKNNDTPNRVRKFRSYRISGDRNMLRDEEVSLKYENTFSKYSIGIQGKYTNRHGEQVWLRSTWEFIYAKWLDKQNIDWKYEETKYNLKTKDNKTTYYTPDFSIYEKGELKYLVEVKGYNKTALYKVKLLKEQYPVKIITIDNVNDYCDGCCYTTELRKWKELQCKKIQQQNEQKSHWRKK